MRLLASLLALALLGSIAADGQAKPPRSNSAVAAFKRANPCPSTGKASTAPCPGHIVDHITPLCAGGADDPSNMQWQTTEAAREKDREEKRACARARRP